VVFVRSDEAKQKLKPALMPNNVEKTMAAPVVAIVAYDTAFFEHLPTQFPVNPGAREMFANNAGLSADTATRNGTLQGAYLIMAARAIGLINLGWGDPSGNRPRGPRLAFADSVRIE
jgi:3-hydroxypropanoate dehydrogenase